MAYAVATTITTWIVVAYGEFIPPTLNLFGNRDFDKVNWLNLSRTLGKERVDQQALWSRMAGGARQGADPCQLSALPYG